MLGNLINGFRPLLRFRQIKRRQCLVSRLAHTALEVHLARSRQLVSIRARIPFLKELRKIRLGDPEMHSISLSAALPLDSAQ